MYHVFIQFKDGTQSHMESDGNSIYSERDCTSGVVRYYVGINKKIYISMDDILFIDIEAKTS